MRFKRVDKSTVRCIVSQDEIEERGLKIEDLIRNGDKAQEFLNEVVDMAEEEIGFKMTSGIQAVQAAFLPNHDVVFTFSDNAESIGIDHALGQLKDMLAEDKIPGMECIDEICDDKGEKRSGEKLLTVFFSEIDHVCRFCERFSGFQFPQESLYKCGSEYALILDTSEIGKDEMAALFMQASEYGKSFVLRDLRAYEIEEHSTCIIKENALSCLQML